MYGRLITGGSDHRNPRTEGRSQGFSHNRRQGAVPGFGRCFAGYGKELLELKVEYCKFFKKFVFVKFEGLDDINEVEKYKRCPLLVTRENAVELEEDEYFVADLLGLTIVDDSGVTIGRLENVISTGANDVYEVLTEDGGRILLPAIKECILDVDMDEGIILVHLMKGLTD